MDDEREIEDLVHALIDAWNTCDAERFAGMFVPSAEYITGQGQCVCGRDSIAELVKNSSAGSPVALVDGPWIACGGVAGTVRFGWASAAQGVSSRRGTITCTLVRQNAGWLIEALQNNEAAIFRGNPTTR